MTERKKLIVTIQNRIDEARNKGLKTTTIFISTLSTCMALLKEQELPTELKQKMWNALYAEEDEYEKKFVGKEEHLNWFTVYRPWLQKGFDIAINAIADWEGR
jgi:hypothetical protein